MWKLSGRIIEENLPASLSAIDSLLVARGSTPNNELFCKYPVKNVIEKQERGSNLSFLARDELHNSKVATAAFGNIAMTAKVLRDKVS